MGLKNIVVFLDPSPAGAARARYAVELAFRHGAHLIGIFVAPTGWPVDPTNSYIRGQEAMRQLIAQHHAHQLTTTHVAGQSFRDATSRAEITYEFRIIREAEDDVRLHCLHADLVIVGHPRPGGLPGNATAESLLLATGVPFLILPESWSAATVATRVLLAWNASREARRAASDSLPILTAAQSVSIVVVDAAKNHHHGEMPGADIALSLSRHGAHVAIEQIDSNGSPVADVIMNYATQNGCDLIALGAYSHARVREAVFGGVTRSLLKSANTPLLIAH